MPFSKLFLELSSFMGSVDAASPVRTILMLESVPAPLILDVCTATCSSSSSSRGKGTLCSEFSRGKDIRCQRDKKRQLQQGNRSRGAVRRLHLELLPGPGAPRLERPLAAIDALLLGLLKPLVAWEEHRLPAEGMDDLDLLQVPPGAHSGVVVPDHEVRELPDVFPLDVKRVLPGALKAAR